jgi:hypothetical protein
MGYAGYNVKFGAYELPNRFLQKDGYTSTPNQRTELSAERDGNIYLHRETSPNYKTSIKLSIMPLSESELQLFHSIVNTDVTIERERKHGSLTYWNVDEHAYKTAEFYVPDIEYTQSFIDSNGIPHYKEFVMELIEY